MPIFAGSCSFLHEVSSLAFVNMASSDSCLIHFDGKKGLLTSFSVVSYQKFLDCRRIWLTLDGEEPFSYPEPFLRAVNRARRGALAKSISNWHLIGYNEGYCSNNVYIFYHVFMVSGFGFGQSPSSHRA